jgi:Ulp1 family protease
MFIIVESMNEDNIAPSSSSSVYVSYHGETFEINNINSLEAGEWFNDSIISFLIYYFVHESKHANRFHIMSSLASQKIIELNADNHYDSATRDSTAARLDINQRHYIDIFNKDYIVFPINPGRNHWSIAIVCFATHRYRASKSAILYFDSLNTTDISFQHRLRIYLTKV